MNNRTRKMIQYGESCGFQLDGLDGQGHYRMVHPNGAVVRVSGSPGDYKGDANCEAEMRRKSGVTPVRPRAGRFSFIRHRGFSMRRALAEKNPEKSGVHTTESAPAEHPVITHLRRRIAALEVQVDETPYPYLIQELRRLRQKLSELSKVSP